MPALLELHVERVGGGFDFAVVLDRRDDDAVGRDGGGPDDAFVVVRGFDGGDEDSADADAVAAHDHGVALAFVVEEFGVERFGVFRAELEDVADLDAAAGFEDAAVVVGRGIAGGGVADVGDGDFLRIGELVAASRNQLKCLTW